MSAAEQKQNVLITGANRGIGLELAKQYLEKGFHVIAAVRKPTEEIKATGSEVIENIDVSLPADVETLKKAIGDRKLDVLVNNAGVLKIDDIDSIDYAEIDREFQINAVGPLRVTEALRPNLKQGSKIGFVSSMMGSIQDNTIGKFYAYRMSKSALNAAAKSLAIDLKPSGVLVSIIHPGSVATQLNPQGDIQADESAAGIIKVLEGLTEENTGSFQDWDGSARNW